MPIRASDMSPNDSESNRNAVRKNIEAVVKMEERSLDNRSNSERLADTIGSFCGSMSFVVIHFVVFTVWIVSNVGILLPVFLDSMRTRLCCSVS